PIKKSKMNMTKLKQSLLAVIIGLALAAGISYAASWVGPTANPPLNNTDAPVNVGGTTQYKTGALGIGGWFAADSGLSWGKSSFLNLDQGGSIELGDGKTKGATPYIDFHYGTGQSQDYNARLINSRDGTLVAKFPKSGGSFVIEGDGSKDSRLTIGDGQPTVWSWANGWATAGDLSLIEENVAGDRIYVKPGGNVGIGTSNPQAKLDVNGTIKAHGNNQINNVDNATLQSFQPRCNLEQTFDSSENVMYCQSGCSRYCFSRGYSGGTITEWHIYGIYDEFDTQSQYKPTSAQCSCIP
ncbi:MAG: hypothetical protein KGJ58_02170, partial [Patescibacteria group bacterium]|nr:hypothetical protein [Patescibacteria group bacterium]MDE2218233.1 hypothetical protein [Patescibacteria group bacterium]